MDACLGMALLAKWRPGFLLVKIICSHNETTRRGEPAPGAAAACAFAAGLRRQET